MDNNKPNIALRVERKSRGWSQKKVADLVGTSEDVICRWERGKRTPTPFFQEQLCGIFGKTAEELGFIQPDLTMSNDRDQGGEDLAGKDKNRSEIENNTRLERLAFALSLDNHDIEVVDFDHHYELMKRFDFIDNEMGMFTSYRWFTVRNIGDIPTNSIIHVECGDNKISFKSMKFRAFEGNPYGQT